MDFAAIQKFFRQHPGMWVFVGLGVIGAVSFLWFVSGYSFGVSSFFAAPAPTATATPTPPESPEDLLPIGGPAPGGGTWYPDPSRYGPTVCPNQPDPCGGVGTAIRVGHNKYLPSIGLLFSETSDADWRKWHWAIPPSDVKTWCDTGDLGYNWFYNHQTQAPAEFVGPIARCIDGSEGLIPRKWAIIIGTPTPTPIPVATPTPTATPVLEPVACSPQAQTVAVRAIAFLQAFGGDGIYHWNVTGGGIVENGGTQDISISYSVPGTKTVSLSSAGATATCLVVVQAAITPAPGTNTNLTVQKGARNVGGGTVTPSESLSVAPGAVIQFVTTVRSTGSAPLANMSVRDTVPPGMSYQIGSTTIEGQVLTVDTITTSGLALGTLAPGDGFTVRWTAVADHTDRLSVGVHEARPLIAISADGMNTTTDDVLLQIQGTGGTGAGTTGGGTAGGVPTGPDDAVIAALFTAATMTLLYAARTRSAAFRHREINRLSQDQGPLDFRS